MKVIDINLCDAELFVSGLKKEDFTTKESRGEEVIEHIENKFHCVIEIRDEPDAMARTLATPHST